MQKMLYLNLDAQACKNTCVYSILIIANTINLKEKKQAYNKQLKDIYKMSKAV